MILNFYFKFRRGLLFTKIKICLTSPLTVLVILLFTLQVNANSGYAQRVTIEEKTVHLSQLFSMLEKQTGYLFFYDKTVLDKTAPVSISVKRASIDQVLDACLAPNELTYAIIKNTIVIREARRGEHPLSKPTEILSADLSTVIRGRVQNKQGKPVQGATVLVVGTKIGTSTDNEGRFSLTLPDNSNVVLEISSIGYQKMRVEASGKGIVEVVLEEDVAGLGDVVVVGYGTQRRKDLTGAIVSVKTGAIQQTPVSSIDQGLVGRAAGVLVTQTSGMPGATASIRIRGASSLQGGNEPLYVIDGVPVYSGQGFGETGGKVKMSALATINPNDIESIEVLKDASATAIYGSRAANGVVLVTTKSGKSGNDVIAFDSYYGVQSIVKKIKVMNGSEYARLVNEAYTNDKLTAPYSEEFISKIPNGGKGTDWQDEVYRRAPMQSYQLSFSGGDAKTTYASSLSYLDQQGIIINSGMSRYSGRLNFTRKMTEKFKVSNHLSFSRNIANMAQTDVGGEGGIPTGALKFNPILPVYSNEDLKIYTPVNVPGALYPNPVATARERKQKNNTTRVLGDISGELEIVKDLKAKVLLGLDYFMNKAGTYVPSNIYQSSGVADGSISDVMYTNWLNENTLTYSKVWPEQHFKRINKSYCLRHLQAL